MPEPVDILSGLTPPEKVEAPAPTQTSNESVNILDGLEPPSKPEQHAVINDAADKAHQWKQADAMGRLKLLISNFGDHFTDETKKTLEKNWTDLNTPLAGGAIPRAPSDTPDIPVPGSPARLPVLAGSYNAAAGLAEGLTTPLNIGTLGMFGALTKVAQGIGPAATAAKNALTVIKTAFAAQMAKGAGEAAGAASVPEGKTTQEQTESVVTALGQSAMAALAAHGAVEDVTSPSARGKATNPEAVNEAIAKKTGENIASADTTLSTPAPNANPITRPVEEIRGNAQPAPSGGEVAGGVSREPVQPAGARPPEEVKAPQEAPVDIGDRSGRPTGAAEEAVVAEQKRLIDEHLAEQAKAAGKPVLAEELTPPAPDSPEAKAITEELSQQPTPAAEPLPTEPPKTVTGIRNAIVDEERASRGLPPAMETAAKEFGTTWDEALKRVDENPNAGIDLVTELRDKPRPITDTENALLLQRQIDLQNQFKKVTDRINEGDENTSPEQRAADQVQLARLSDDLLDIYNVGRQVGTEQGRGLAARKMLANEDFSLAAMETARRAANDGKPLTKAQSDEVAALHEKIAATQKAFDDYVAAQAAKRPRSATSSRDRNIISTFISEKANAARERIKARALEGRVQSNLDPIDLADHAIVGADYIARGIENFAEWGNAMVKEFGERIKPHLQAIFDKSKIEAEDALLNARLESRKNRLEARIKELKEKIQSGDTAAEPRPKNRPSIKEIETLQQERDSLNKEIAKNREKIPLVGGPEPATPEQIRLKSFKTRAENAARDYEERLAKGDFGPAEKPEPLRLDAEAERLKAAAYRAKVEFQAALIQDRLNNRTSFEKAQDTLVKWRRGFLLSGPGTLIKLTAAAVNRVVQTPIEEGVGAAIGSAVPDVAAKAPRQGGLNTEAEAAALSGAFFRGLQDAAQTLKTGHSDLDVLYGKGAGKNVRESDVLPRSVIDFFGSLHGALKAPVKRAEFERSFEKRMAFAIKEGADVTDPMVQTKIAVDAYKDANRAIFMQDNVVTDAWNAGIARLTKADKEGNVSPAGKAVATTMRVLLPIVKVPTNIVAETFETATGSVTGSVKLAQAIRNGTENLTPEQADIIMRQLKKGSLGLALLALGYFNPENAGGYYQQGDKRKPGDVKAVNIRLFGVDVPSLLIHNPAVEVVQLGATIRRVADSKIKGKEKGLSAGIASAVLGLGEELPFVKTPIELAKLFNPREREQAKGDLVRGLVVPEAVQSTARFLDKDSHGNPIKRSPRDVVENVETGIPGLRETVRKK